MSDQTDDCFSALVACEDAESGFLDSRLHDRPLANRDLTLHGRLARLFYEVDGSVNVNWDRVLSLAVQCVEEDPISHGASQSVVCPIALVAHTIATTAPDAGETFGRLAMYETSRRLLSRASVNAPRDVLTRAWHYVSIYGPWLGWEVDTKGIVDAYMLRALPLTREVDLSMRDRMLPALLYCDIAWEDRRISDCQTFLWRVISIWDTLDQRSRDQVELFRLMWDKVYDNHPKTDVLCPRPRPLALASGFILPGTTR